MVPEEQFPCLLREESFPEYSEAADTSKDAHDGVPRNPNVTLSDRSTPVNI